MALTGTASRFACLPDDDNTDWIAPKSKKGKYLRRIFGPWASTGVLVLCGIKKIFCLWGGG